MALLGLLWMLLTPQGVQRLQSLPLRLHGGVWLALLYLGLVASAGTLMLQAWAQRKVAPAQAAVIYTMEPVFATLFGCFGLSESLTPHAALGALLMVLALLTSEVGWRHGKWFRRAPDPPPK